MSSVGDLFWVTLAISSTTELTPVLKLWAINLPSGVLVPRGAHAHGVPSLDQITSGATNTGCVLVALDS